MVRKLLTRPEQQPKTRKGEVLGWLTYPLHFAPSDLSGFNVCPFAGVCRDPCLNLAGRGIFTGVQAARIARTQWFFTDRAAFLCQLVREIRAAERAAARRGLRLAIRLNATSDVPWHRVPVAGYANIMEMFPEVQFYDYTKVVKRLFEPLPVNYHLTFSADGTNDAACDRVLAAGKNVAVVYRTRAMAESVIGKTLWRGAEIIDGDETDARFLDRQGCVVALYAKGRARRNTSVFVHDVELTAAA